ncbi:YggL family protein [Cupriavidus metallidurans]|uniref:YggL family protein n=1 Tax=Cupriavidus metallidurans TaxID=119219 RepID=UPI0016463680|nr:YggL family protein [Cupriavidus metallidurans]
MSQRRSRRQRKKLRVAEFQELGFLVTAELAVGLGADAKIAACEAFIADCIEANQLTYGGAIDDCLDGFVSPDGNRSSSTEEHRQIVLDWLNGRAEFGAVRVGPLIDAWYGNFAELG